MKQQERTEAKAGNVGFASDGGASLPGRVAAGIGSAECFGSKFEVQGGKLSAQIERIGGSEVLSGEPVFLETQSRGVSSQAQGSSD
ncbi:MAG: hypothetical protein BWX83_01031 [Candidatus Cloacimonetes bacterium ADurb.Bin117]|nr:MAG: hypothetical protein BWX83_01031 [Candidatus Cloacimonetes bacterium ADurb.Bin117]